LVLNFTYVL